MMKRILAIGLLYSLGGNVFAEDPADKASAFSNAIVAISSGNLEQVRSHLSKVDATKIPNLRVLVLQNPNADAVRFVRDKYQLSISDVQIAAIGGDTRTLTRVLSAHGLEERKKILNAGSAAPLMSHSPLMLACTHGQTAAVGILIAAGANVNESTHYSFTPLAQAAEHGHVAVVKKLLASKANANLAADGYTPLMRACLGSRSKTVKQLLQSGADPNLKRKDGQTALHFAARNGSTACVEMLIEAGAHLRPRAYGKLTPLSYAKRHGHDEIVRQLEEAEEDREEQFEERLRFISPR